MTTRAIPRPPALRHGRVIGVLNDAFAGSAAFAVLAEVEAVLHSGSVDVLTLTLSGWVGALVGIVLGRVRARACDFGTMRRFLGWVLAGTAAGLWPALAVGAVAKLGGPHRTMAALTLCGGAVAGATFGLCLFLADLGEKRGQRHWRLAVVGLAVVVTLVAETVDETLLVLHAYPPMRLALVVVTWTFVADAGLAVASVAGGRLPSSIWRSRLEWAWFGALALGLVATAKTPEDRVAPLLLRPTSSHLVELARTATDFDRDGSSSWFGGGDCAPFDPKVNPSAREIPGNGVDDNCRYGDAPLRMAVAPDTTMPASPSPVNVVLISIDTLRADHVGSYGYFRPTTPRIDAFARGARRFERAYTSGGWTCIALHSLMSGLYARRLDWEAVAITSKDRMLPFPWEGTLEPGEEWLANLSAPIRTPATSLPLWLRRRGMQTAVVIAPKPGAILGYRDFLTKSFDQVRVTPSGTNDAVVADGAIDVLKSFGAAPFFLWAHFFEPHDPYDHHAEVPAFGDRLEDKYDHDVAFSDFEVGRLLDAIDARGGRPTAVVITADHGESFIGGSPVHGEDLHEESIRIPMFIRGPGIAPGASDVRASLVDIAPTLFDWTETPIPPGLDGTSLLHAPPRRALITDIWRHDRSGKLYIDLVGATGDIRRLVRDRIAEASFTYRVGDMARPLTPLHEREDPLLADTLGRYFEEAGILE